MSKKLILFPFGGNAREALMAILDINKTKKEWEVLGFVDDDPETWDKDIYGYKVLGDREVLKKESDVQVLAVPGNPRNYSKRAEIIDGLGVDESRFATVIHPTVVVAPDSKIGFNTLILPNVVVGATTSIGNHCIFLPNTTIAHDVIINDYCCIGSNVVVSGYVVVKESCYVASSTSIRNNILIEEKTLVGLGSNIIANIEKEVIVAGNPARIIRKEPK